MASARAQRQPDPHLLGAARDRVRNHAVQPDRSHHSDFMGARGPACQQQVGQVASLLSQGIHGVQARGAAGRQVAGDQGDHAQQSSGKNQHYGVVRGDAEQQRLDRLS